MTSPFLFTPRSLCFCSCTDGYGRSCLAVVLLAMFLDSDLPPMVAMEIVQRARGPAAIQTIKVVCHFIVYSVCMHVSVRVLCTPSTTH